MCLYHYKVLLGEFSLVLTPPPGDLPLLTQELMEIVRTVRELLPQFAQALDHLCDSENYQNPNITSADERCLAYSDTITEKLDRGGLIERELIRYNPRLKSKIIQELQILKDLNSRW